MSRKKIPPVVETPKPWGITQADLDQTTDLELAFSTLRCLPAEDIIPEQFKGPYQGDYESNVYVALVDALFCGEPPPDRELEFKDGFTGNNLMKFIAAHLRSFEPKHEHKIAGLAYMIAQIMTIKE